MTTTTETGTTVARTFEIHEDRIDWLQTRIDKLAKRAARLGIEAPSMTITETKMVKRMSDDHGVWFEKHCMVTISGTAPRLNGWHFVARLEHTEEGNIIAPMPSHDGSDLPEVYRTTGPICEHCNVSRRRNDTFVVRHDDGSYKQVGRQCLKDFTGHPSPEGLAAVAESLGEALALAEYASEEGDGCGFGLGGIRWVSLEDYLADVAESVAQHGYRSRQKATFGEIATCDEAWDALISRIRPNGRRPAPEPSPRSFERARAAVAWARDLTKNPADVLSDYLHNAHVVACREVVDAMHIGIAASIVVAYERVQEREAARAHAAAVSKHQGNVGDRLGKKTPIEMTVVRIISIETEWGGLHIHVFNDDDGNVYVWKTGSVRLEGGERYAVKGTVKAHTEYKDVAQTELTRCVATLVKKAA